MGEVTCRALALGGVGIGVAASRRRFDQVVERATQLGQGGVIRLLASTHAGNRAASGATPAGSRLQRAIAGA